MRPHVLREYALIADGERGAPIGPEGDVCRLCFPALALPARPDVAVILRRVEVCSGPGGSRSSSCLRGDYGRGAISGPGYPGGAAPVAAAAIGERWTDPDAMQTPTSPVNFACAHAANDASSSWRVWTKRGRST